MNDEIISGHGLRLSWLRGELCRFLGECRDDQERDELVGWYLKYGYSIGISRQDLVDGLADIPELRSIASGIDDEEIHQGKHPPEFRKGTEVEVIVNAKNLTYRRGRICEHVWHFEKSEWIFHIEVDGKRIGKRYFASDLKEPESTTSPLHTDGHVGLAGLRTG